MHLEVQSQREVICSFQVIRSNKNNYLLRKNFGGSEVFQSPLPKNIWLKNLRRVSPIVSLKHDELIEKWQRKLHNNNCILFPINIYYNINIKFLMSKTFLHEDNLILISVVLLTWRHVNVYLSLYTQERMKGKKVNTQYTPYS